jgi:hypothetical protein
MKLSKTETQLIESARANGGRGGIETCYGRGARGGKIKYGARERDALFKLVNRGMAVITDRQPWQDYNNGYGVGGTVISFKLI